MSRVTAAVAAAATALAAWVSQSALAFTGTGDLRVAVFSLSAISIGAAVAAGLFVWLAWRAGASLAPLWLLVLLGLPWISASAPAAFLIWSGSMALAVWVAVIVSILAGLPRISAMPGRLKPSPAAAGAIALVVYSIAAWQVVPSLPAGDEPHYLIITQSLLKDHDLRIANNHRQGDYRDYYAGDLPKPDYRRPGRNGEIYSIHAPGLPVLIAPAFAVAGYHGVVVFLILIASVVSALAWQLAWMVTGRSDAAWFGWAAVTFSTSGIFHSFAVYPDGVGGAIVLSGAWALLRAGRESETGSERVAPWWLHGAALAALPWIHTRFALLAGGFGALILLRLSTTRNSAAKAVAFLLVPAVSALCWIGFFIAIYGTPDPAAPYANEQGAAAFIPGGLAGLFFDQRFGVLVYAPALVCGLAGFVVMLRDRARRRLGLELLFVMVPYLLAVTHFAMWWGGASAPGRFFVPLLSAMAIPCAVGWTAIRHRSTRATVLAALAYTAFASSALILVGHGRLAYNVRQAYSLWLDWLSGNADLTLGTPSWWAGQQITRMLLVRDTAVWLALFIGAWLLLRAVERHAWLRSRGALCAAAAGAYAAAIMTSLTIVWALGGVRPVNSVPAQIELLRRVSREARLLALTLPSFERVPAENVPPMLRIQPRSSEAPGGAGANDRPLYQIPLVPAGTYRVRPQLAGRAGWLMVGIGRDQFSLSSGPLDADPPVLDFPVDVRAIVIRGDEQARRAVRSVAIEPVAIIPPARRLTSDHARRAVRYAGATVFFLDDRSFPEPEAFWIGGKRRSTIVVQPKEPRAQATLLLRNAPVDNHVTIESGSWRDDLQLAPGEERRISLPVEQPRNAALLTVTTTSGFRPSAIDPRNRDDRFLGVLVRLPGD